MSPLLVAIILTPIGWLFAVLWGWGALRFEPIALQSGEAILRKSHAVLRGNLHAVPKNGHAYLTTKRFIWLPARFPLFTAAAMMSVELPLTEIEECDANTGLWMAVGGYDTLRITSRGKRLELFLHQALPWQDPGANLRPSWAEAIRAQQAELGAGRETVSPPAGAASVALPADDSEVKKGGAHWTSNRVLWFVAGGFDVAAAGGLGVAGTLLLATGETVVGLSLTWSGLVLAGFAVFVILRARKARPAAPPARST